MKRSWALIKRYGITGAVVCLLCFITGCATVEKHSFTCLESQR